MHKLNLLSNMRHLKDGKKPQKPKEAAMDEEHQARRRDVLQKLEHMYGRLKEVGSTEIHRDLRVALCINLGNFTLKTDGTPLSYFSPWSLEDLENHRIDTQDKATRLFYPTFEEVMAHIEEEKREDPSRGAEFLGAHLNHYFAGFYRTGLTGSGTLAKLSGLREGLVGFTFSIPLGGLTLSDNS